MEENKNLFQNQPDIDLKKILWHYLSYWPWFILSVFLAIGLVFVFNAKSTPLYVVSSSVLIKDDNTMQDPSEMLFGSGLFEGSSNIVNELIILKSLPLLEETVTSLGLEIAYYRPTDFRIVELYQTCPFKIELKDKSNKGPEGVFIHVQFVTPNRFKLNGEGEIWPGGEPFSITGEYAFGDWIPTQVGAFRLVKSDSATLIEKDSEWAFKIFNPQNLARNYKQALTVSPELDKSSILKLTLQGGIPRKEIDFLNRLMKKYIRRNLNDKNLASVNTIQFIDKELASITDSLNLIERQLEKFKSKNRPNISEEGSTIMGQINTLENEKSQYVVRAKYYKYLEESLGSPSNLDKLISPESFGVKAPAIVNQMTQELADLQLQKSAMLQEGITKSPFLGQISSRIESIQKNLIDNIRSLSASNDIMINDLDQRLKLVEDAVKTLPGSERQFINIQRIYNLNENLYLLLMNKKAEAEIATSSNVPDFKVVEPAMLVNMNPVFPNKKLNYALGIFFGLFFPVLIILSRGLISNKISSREDIENNTDIPFLGNVFFQKDKGVDFIASKPKSSLAESFRAIRTNLNFLTPGQEHKTFLFTSFTSGEGKTYCSSILSMVLALSGHKTVIVGADLRKPRIHEEFDLPNNDGLSSYLSGQSSYEDIIVDTNQEKLFLIPAGPIPPNPADLFLEERMEILMKRLKEEFDFVIFDSSPIGLVIDSYWLMPYVDVSIFVLRQNYSLIESIKTLNKLQKEEKIVRPGIIFNGLKMGEQYGYGYGYGYYDDEPKNFWDKLKIRFSNIFSR